MTLLQLKQLLQVKLTLWVASLTCMRFMASRIWSRWWAELSASRRMSVNLSSFSLSSFFSWRTISASASVHSHSLQLGLHTGRREVGWSLRGEGMWRWGVTLTVMAAQRSAEVREINRESETFASSVCFRGVHPHHFLTEWVNFLHFSTHWQSTREVSTLQVFFSNQYF